MIEPGTLIIGVSKEGILYQLQLCGGQEGMGLCQHVGRILDIPTALQPKSHLYPGLTQELQVSVRSSLIRWFRAGLDRHQDWGGPAESFLICYPIMQFLMLW